MEMSVFLLVRALPAWLALPREDRNKIASTAFEAANPRGELSIRHFDAEAFSAPCSDVMLVENVSPAAHYAFIERLRDTPLFGHPYFEMLSIIPAVEDGFRQFEADTLERDQGRPARA